MKSSKAERKDLWQAAIKWPLYSVAVMPVLLAAGWKLGKGDDFRLDQFVGFLMASIFILLWENLTNDLFDDETGVDEFKFHSVVALTGSRSTVKKIAYLSLIIGLGLVVFLAASSNIAVLFLVLICCLLGYLYQGPPFRLGYKGLGEPLCWLAFGPLATSAALLVLSPQQKLATNIPWKEASLIGAGPAFATTLVLFCSHFHQVNEDANHGKKSPLVLLGTRKASQLIPWFIGLIFALEIIPIITGHWPITALLGLTSLPIACKLIKLISKYHNQPSFISNSKFVALRFQTINGISITIGFAISSLLNIN